MNLRLYIVSTTLFLIGVVGGFYTGRAVSLKLYFPMAASSYSEEALGFLPYLFFFSFSGAFIGFFASLIIIHKLGKRWGSQLNFGGHPVLKLTSLSFLTFLGLLFLLLLFYPSK